MKGMRKLRRGLWFDGRREAFSEIVIPGTAGHRRSRRTLSVRTRAEAEAGHAEHRREALSAARGSVEKKAEIPTFREYVERHWPIGEINPASQKNQRSAIEVSLNPFFGAVRLDEITGASVKDFRIALKQRGYVNPTVNTRVRLLRKIVNDAFEREVLPALPRKWPRALPEEQLRNEASDAERQALLSTFDDQAGYTSLLALEARQGGSMASWGPGRPADYFYGLFRAAKLVFVAAFETGLSRSDLLGLEWASVDFQAGLIRVQRQKTGVWSIIPISNLCREALLEAKGRAIVSTRHVFVTAEGKRYSVSSITRYFNRAKKLAGIKRRFRFHDLRHSYGSNLARKGVPALMIKDAMGHRNVRTTERYAKIDEAAIKQFVLSALNSSD